MGLHPATVPAARAAVINSATFSPIQQDLLKGAIGNFQLIIEGQVTAADVAQGVIRFNINREVVGSNFDDQLIRVRAPCANATVLQNFRAVVDFGLRCKADCSLEGAGISSIVFTDTATNQVICQSGQAADTGGSGTGTTNPHNVVVESVDSSGKGNVGMMEINCLAQQDCGDGLCGYFNLPVLGLTLTGIFVMRRGLRSNRRK